MKKDVQKFLQQLEQSRAQGINTATKHYGLIHEDCREDFISSTEERLHKIRDKKEVVIKKHEKLRKVPKERQLNVFTSMAILTGSIFATAGIASLAALDTDVQKATLAYSYFAGSLVGAGNVYACATKPLSNLINNLRIRGLQSKYMELSRDEAFTEGYISQFNELQAEAEHSM